MNDADNDVPTTFRLRRSGQPTLRINNATRVAYSPGKQRAGREHSRHHDLTLYALPGGNWALHVEYVTRFEGEPGHSLAVLCGTQAEVAQALAAYDPCARVLGYPPGEQFRAKQERLLKEIRGHYEAQVAELLDDAGFVVGG